MLGLSLEDENVGAHDSKDSWFESSSPHPDINRLRQTSPVDLLV